MKEMLGIEFSEILSLVVSPVTEQGQDCEGRPWSKLE